MCQAAYWQAQASLHRDAIEILKLRRQMEVDQLEGRVLSKNLWDSVFTWEARTHHIIWHTANEYFPQSYTDEQVEEEIQLLKTLLQKRKAIVPANTEPRKRARQEDLEESRSGNGGGAPAPERNQNDEEEEQGKNDDREENTLE